MDKKYEFTSNTRTVRISKNTRPTYAKQIRALKDFICNGRQVKKGDLGGFISSEYNLSHRGNCWVFDNACVVKKAKVLDDACVEWGAIVTDNVTLSDNSLASNTTIITGNTELHHNAKVLNFAMVNGKVSLLNDTIVRDKANIFGYATIKEHAVVSEKATVGGYAIVTGNACVSGKANINERAYICNNAIIRPEKEVYIGGYTHIGKSALIQNYNDFITFGPVDNVIKYMTIYRTKEDPILKNMMVFYHYIQRKNETADYINVNLTTFMQDYTAEQTDSDRFIKLCLTFADIVGK